MINDVCGIDVSASTHTHTHTVVATDVVINKKQQAEDALFR